MRNSILRLTICLLTILPICVVAKHKKDKIDYMDANFKITDSAYASFYIFYTKDTVGYKIKLFRVSDDDLIMKGHCAKRNGSFDGKFVFYKNGYKIKEGGIIKMIY